MPELIPRTKGSRAWPRPPQRAELIIPTPRHIGVSSSAIAISLGMAGRARERRPVFTGPERVTAFWMLGAATERFSTTFEARFVSSTELNWRLAGPRQPRDRSKDLTPQSLLVTLSTGPLSTRPIS